MCTFRRDIASCLSKVLIFLQRSFRAFVGSNSIRKVRIMICLAVSIDHGTTSGQKDRPTVRFATRSLLIEDAATLSVDRI